MKAKSKPISKKFEEKTRALEVGDICRIESERNIRHKGQPLNGRYGKIVELSADAKGCIAAHFELQPSSQKRDVSYAEARDSARYYQDYGRRHVEHRAPETIWISSSALKFVRSEEDELFQKRLKEARAHNAPKKDWRGNTVQPQGTYNLATGSVEYSPNHAIADALFTALNAQKPPKP